MTRAPLGESWRAARAARGSDPVFLLGPARGGTTLLYKTLCLHPGVTYVSNYLARAPRLPELAALNGVARRLPDRQGDAWFNGGGNAYVYGSERSWSRRLLPAPVEGEPFFRACGVPQFAGEPHPTPSEQVRRLRRATRRLRAADGGRVFVSKRIAHNRRIPLLLEAFPKARFVRLVRDGRAVALSLSKVDWWLDDVVWWYGGTPRQWQLEGHDPWEICARNWTQELAAMDNGLCDVSPDRILDVRYEDVVAAPLASLDRLRDFTGLPPSASWSARLATLRFPGDSEGWRRSLSPGTLRVVEGVQAEVLRARGYSLSPEST